jgi:hypothetical protein|nr:MAG TPA: hypothetical protein [Caudoviricetes sp.]
MDKQTFIDNMTARGYELRYGHNGNITATKGDNTVRLVPLANYIVYVNTPTVTAITREGATDAETLRVIDGLTA